MKQSQTRAILWFLAAAASLLAGLLDQPRPLAIVAGILFIILGLVTLIRS